MEPNPNTQRIEVTLEGEIFDAKQNHPFEVNLMLRGENFNLTATWSMDEHGPLITTHERFATELSDFPVLDELTDTDIALPMGHKVFDALCVGQNTSHRFDDGRVVSSTKPKPR